MEQGISKTSANVEESENVLSNSATMPEDIKKDELAEEEEKLIPTMSENVLKSSETIPDDIKKDELAEEEKLIPTVSENVLKSSVTVPEDIKKDELGEEEEKLISTMSELKANIHDHLDADTSGESIRTRLLEEEINDMYEMSDEEDEEEGEEEDDGEEVEEEEDLSEFRVELQEKYMKGMEINADYVDRVNKKIAEVPQQIYAFEVYINSVQTYYGGSGHWLRLKLFDSPCFEIHSCKQVELRSSLLGIGPLIETEGTDYDPFAEEVEEGEIEEDFMDLSSKANANSQANTINFEPEITAESLTHDSDAQLTREDDERHQESLTFKDLLECGKTIMFPMLPNELIHMIQRRPLVMTVMSPSKAESKAVLDLTSLIEVVIRASKGPPYPISSFFRFNLATNGDYFAKVSGTIKLIAFGTQDVCPIICVDNPNEIKSQCYRREKPILKKWNMDCQNKAAMLTGPQKFTLYDIAKIIGDRKSAKEFKLPPKPEQKKYFVEDLEFDRKANSVTRAPKKTFDMFRAQIEKYLVLNKSSKERDASEKGQSEDICDELEDSASSILLEGIEEELFEEFKFEETATPTKRIEAVLNSLRQSYK